MSHYCRIALPIPSLSHGSYVALIWLWVACPGFSRFEVGSSKFGVHHKNSKYNPTIPPPSGWSGGTLVPPWTCPIPIEGPKGALFKQATLSKSLFCGIAAVKRFGSGRLRDSPTRRPLSNHRLPHVLVTAPPFPPKYPPVDFKQGAEWSINRTQPHTHFKYFIPTPRCV